MIRYFFCIILAVVFLNAEPVNVDKAFSVKASMSEQGASFEFDLDDTVYLYEDKFKVKIGSTDITNLLNLPESLTHKVHQVYAEDFSIFVPAGLILSSGNLDKFRVDIKNEVKLLH